MQINSTDTAVQKQNEVTQVTPPVQKSSLSIELQKVFPIALSMLIEEYARPRPHAAIFLDTVGVLMDDTHAAPLNEKIQKQAANLFNGRSCTDLEWRIAEAQFLEPAAVSNLNSLIKKLSAIADVVIVMTGEMRIDATVDEMKNRVFAQYDFTNHIFDKTPNRFEQIERDGQRLRRYGIEVNNRAAEIAYWLGMNGHLCINSFVILNESDKGISGKFPDNYIAVNSLFSSADMQKAAKTLSFVSLPPRALAFILKHKLVENEEELEALAWIIGTTKIASESEKNLVNKFSRKTEGVLGTVAEADTISMLFHMMLELISADGLGKRRKILIFDLKTCFTNVQKRSITLPYSIHKKTLRVCEELLGRTDLALSEREYTVELLSQIMNHKDFSLDTQRCVFNLLHLDTQLYLPDRLLKEKYASHIYWREYLASPHIPSECRDSAAQICLAGLGNTQYSNVLRESYLYTFFAARLHISLESRNEFISRMLALMNNFNEQLELRKSAALFLTRFVTWGAKKGVDLELTRLSESLWACVVRKTLPPEVQTIIKKQLPTSESQV